MIKIDEQLCVGCGWCVNDCTIGYLAIKEPEHIVSAAGDRCIMCGHCEAVCPREAIQVVQAGYEAYEDFDLDDAYVEPKELFDFMANIRSVRNFRDKEIEPEKIKMIIDAGRFSPTGCNFQNTGYIVIKDNLDDLKKEAALALEGELLEKLSMSINRTTLERIVDEAKNGGDRLFFGAPLVIGLTDLKGSSGVDIGIAASRMELLANSLGLGVCFNGIFPNIANASQKISDMISLPCNRKLVTSLVIGYPAISYMRPPKRRRANLKNI